jgi:hypothetical protein
LKAPVRTARAEVVPAELLDEFDLASYDPVAAADVGFAKGTLGGACSSAQKVSWSSSCRRIVVSFSWSRPVRG